MHHSHGNQVIFKSLWWHVGLNMIATIGYSYLYLRYNIINDSVIYHDLLKGDRVIFAESPSAPGIPVVYRTPEERSSNPDRLNLDRYSMLVYDFSSPGL